MSSTKGTQQFDHEDIIEYYDKTQMDYKYAWDNSETPALHFGYYENESGKHTDALMNTNRVLAERAVIKAGDKVLDAGCGKGGSSLWLALNKKAQVTGITIVQSQIDACQEQAKKLALENQTSFVRADYCNTPFADSSFDVIWALESVCHAQDKSDFYAEAYRLLKPGGRIIIAEYLRAQRPLPVSGETKLKAWLERWAIADIDTEEEHKNNAQQAGFKNTRIDIVTKNMKRSLRNLHNNSKKWFWLGKLMKTFGMRSKVQQENMKASMIQYEALEQGLWEYSFIYGEKN